MKQFKALIRKEWQTHRSTILIPLWFTGAVYVIGILGLMINFIREGRLTIVTGGMKWVPWKPQSDFMASVCHADDAGHGFHHYSDYRQMG